MRNEKTSHTGKILENTYPEKDLYTEYAQSLDPREHQCLRTSKGSAKTLLTDPYSKLLSISSSERLKTVVREKWVEMLLKDV